MRLRFLVFTVLLGCGGDDTSIDINADQNNVCGEVAEVACHNMYQCCSEGEIEQLLQVSDARSEAECRDDVRRTCARAIALHDVGIDQDRVRFDAQTMNECLEALVAPGDTCATIASALPWTEACLSSAWIGLVQDGGSCLSTSECANKDSVCGGSQTCVALPTDGRPCRAGACATGAFCDDGTCRAQLPAGGACVSSIECLDHLFCDTTVASGTCTPLHVLGERCTGNASCTSSRCNPGTCARSGQTCLTNSTCGGQCEGSQLLCSNDSQCSTGTCSLTATFCSNVTPCTGAGNVCTFPIHCVLDECVGDVVCAEPHVVVDYCQGAIDDLPVPVIDQPQTGRM
jgi:hypothetical protein